MCPSKGAPNILAMVHQSAVIIKSLCRDLHTCSHAIILINNLIIKHESCELSNGFQDWVSLLGCKRSEEIINYFGKALNLENTISTLLYDKSLLIMVNSSENLNNRYGSFSYFCNTIRKMIIADSTKHHRKSQIPS